MINFCRKNYLGTSKQFKLRFASPITEGEDKDATQWQVERMRKRSFVLNKRLSSIVDRKARFFPLYFFFFESILSVLKNSLMIEYFVI